MNRSALLIASIAILSVSLIIGIGYAVSSYTGTTATSNNSVSSTYGIASMEYVDGAYHIKYTDLTADTAYMKVEASGFAYDPNNPTIPELWIGSESIQTSNFGYVSECSGSALTSLKKQMSGTTFTDKGTNFTVSYNGTTLSVTGADYVMGLNFFHGTDIYMVTVSGSNITNVYRIITFTDHSSAYTFNDDGYSYRFTVSNGNVANIKRCVPLYSQVKSDGSATFDMLQVTGLQTASFDRTIEILCNGNFMDISQLDITATFYSTGATS